MNSTDPAKELEWLVNELQFAEDNNEMVHIIGTNTHMNQQKKNKFVLF